ncbi:MAG TPA: MaoC family dehydratase, partial [Dehalococcoidia bacterium]|nr:MaoC family dehydratase [Dehalococcoidia bacterium]
GLVALPTPAPGQELPALTRTVTREAIRRYAEASGDFNRLHLDEEFARTTPFGGTVAHGMLVLAYLSEMLTGAFGRAWLAGGSLKVRFRAPARPGDTVTATGRVVAIDSGQVRCTVACYNGQGEALITGDVEIGGTMLSRIKPNDVASAGIQE